MGNIGKKWAKRTFTMAASELESKHCLALSRSSLTQASAFHMYTEALFSARNFSLSSWKWFEDDLPSLTFYWNFPLMGPCDATLCFKFSFKSMFYITAPGFIIHLERSNNTLITYSSSDFVANFINGKKSCKIYFALNITITAILVKKDLISIILEETVFTSMHYT